MSIPGNFVFDLLARQEQFAELCSAYRDLSVVNVHGLDDTAAMAVIGALRQKSDCPFIVVSENELLARRQAEDLNAMGIRAKSLPSREVSFLKTDAASREISLQRISAMGDFVLGEIQVLVVSADALGNRVMPRESFRRHIVSIEPGMQIQPAELMTMLTEAGYERVDIVESRGQCSLRGGLIDIYPVSLPNAVRIEFFDDEIDSVREFDVLTQRSLGAVKQAVVYPAKEVLLDKDEALAAARRLEEILGADSTDDKLDRQRSIEKEYDLEPFEKFFEIASENDDLNEEIPDEELPSMWELNEKQPEKTESAQKPKTALEKRFFPIIDALKNGRALDTDGMLINLLCENSTSVFDFMPEASVFILHGDRIRERCSSLYDDFMLAFKAAFERGEALKEQCAVLLTIDELVPCIKKHKIVTVDSFLRSKQEFAPEKLIKLEALGTPGFNLNIKELAKEIERKIQNREYVALLSGGVARGQRLTTALADENVIVPFSENLPEKLEAGKPLILPINFASGFIFPEAKFTVYCEDDIFGKGKQHKRVVSGSGNKLAAFTELKVGDYVVHENHGIGQYLGTVRMTVDGTSRDFLNIRYGGTDKLYVPTDQMDRIQKYIGSEGEAPKLNRLSGGEWQKQKAKVKRAIKEIAGDLIKLYAERSAVPGYAFSADTPWQQEFEDAFPFEETQDQITAIAEIKADMERPQVMDRLLCGDVGYGKTEVALRAIFKCIMDGKQAVLLAPTTILVQQHYATALNRFANFPIRIDSLSRFKTPNEQKEVIRKLKAGELDFVIGTHRLLAKEIEYKDLGLLVVDEEQRFGVGHKEAIKQYKKSVDVLTLSATPIPRTLHMSMVGIRDMSVLKTPPDERLPVQTYVVEYSDGLVRDAIMRELSRGGQVYVLHNRVQSIELMYNRLKKLVPEARIAVGHGQMREQQLEDVMLDFYDGKFDVLLCTTIIEAGLDVPRANTLIVCDADKFGLSQLYQLRGRVGRSNRIAYAYLTVNPSKVLTQEAEKRLNAIREFTEFGSGFRVAMRDMEIRGTGNLLGAEQSGHMATVGYDLYLKMIDETIHEMQGTAVPPPVQTRIELTLDAYLPADYVTGDSMRIEMYKKIAEVRDDESRDDIIDELIDRFGDPGKPVMNLIYIAQLKSMCERLYIDNVSRKDDVLLMRFTEDAKIDLTLLLKSVAEDKRLKFLPRKPGYLAFSGGKSSIEKMIVDCTKALDVLIDKLGVREEPKKADEENEEG